MVSYPTVELSLTSLLQWSQRMCERFTTRVNTTGLVRLLIAPERFRFLLVNAEVYRSIDRLLVLVSSTTSTSTRNPWLETRSETSTFALLPLLRSNSGIS